MTEYKYLHLFYIDFNSHPIVLSSRFGETHRVVETRVDSEYDSDTRTETITFKHKVEVIKI